MSSSLRYNIKWRDGLSKIWYHKFVWKTMVFLCICYCRNVSVKTAVRRSPQQRTSQVHKTGIKTLKTFKLTYELLNLWFHPLKYSSHHVFINLYLRYVVGTNPPSIHTCNSCRRYVMVTYRPILFLSCRKYVSDTCNSGELILIGTG